MTTETGSDRPIDFEQHLAELEQIVAEMERGEMTLERSLCAYEAGIALTRKCQAALDAAQQRIAVLTEGAGVSGAPPLGDAGDGQARCLDDA